MDFLSFNSIDENKYTDKAKNSANGVPTIGTNDIKDIHNGSIDDELSLQNKSDNYHYPWLSKRTMRIKDISLFLHSEILDFIEFLKESP